MDVKQITGQVIGAAIEIHNAHAPGFLKTVYEECLHQELTLISELIDFLGLHLPVADPGSTG